MSLLRALRAYVGLGPDEDYENAGRSSSVSGGSGTADRSLVHNDEYWSYGAAGESGGGRSTTDTAVSNSVRSARDGRPPSRRRVEAGPARRETHDVNNDAPHQEYDRDRTTSDVGHDDQVEGDQTSGFYEESTDDGRYEEIDLRDAADSDETTAAGPTDVEQGGIAVVKSIDVARMKPRTVSPESFAEAKELADEFKHGIPVVLNLQGQDRELARRLIDFASGVCYCLDGTMEKIGPNVFLLTPDGVEVGEEDRLRIMQRGYAR